MSIDINQFLDTFYEESFEGLDTMETELLALTPGEADEESINTIFRAAHSIKGGSGTFGLTVVSDFTHVLETLLDEMRDGRREVTQPAVDLMLASVDVLRDMLSALRDGNEIDAPRVADVHGQLEALLKGAEAGAGEGETVLEAAPVEQEQAGSSRWTIEFKPFSHLFKSGNDPVRIMMELADLGTVRASVNLDALPELDLLDPEECYLSWFIEVEGDISEEQLKDVFAWVEDDCELSFERGQIEASAAADQDVAATEDVPPTRQGNEEGEAKPPSPAAPPANQAAAAKKAQGGESGSIRVGIDKVDALINMVGELVITQSMLN